MKIFYLGIVGGSLLLLLSACSPSPVHLSRNFGDSARLAVELQLLDPEARKNLAPVYNLDGQAAGTTILEYWKSFKAEERTAPPPSLILRAGGAAGS